MEKPTYKILAVCKQYSEWEVDHSGDITECVHEFEGADINYYKIVSDEGLDDPIYENENYLLTVAKLSELTK
jgi:hypothetical protein